MHPAFDFASFSRKGTPKKDPFYEQLKASVDVIRGRLKKELPKFKESCGYREDDVRSILLQ